MKLSVKDRLLLGIILPGEGNFTTLKIIRKLREDLSFSEEEYKLLQFQSKENSTIWSVEGQNAIGEKEISIGEKATDIIVGVLKKLNDEKKLTMEHMDLYEKFVEKEG